MEEDSKAGKLPEVNPSGSFAPKSELNRPSGKNEEMHRAAGSESKVPEAAYDDFADENSGISDAHLSNRQKEGDSIPVANAPAMKTSRDKAYDAHGAITSEAIAEGQGSKTRGQEKIINTVSSDVEQGGANLGSNQEWSQASSSTNKYWTDDSPPAGASSEQEGGKSSQDNKSTSSFSSPDSKKDNTLKNNNKRSSYTSSDVGSGSSFSDMQRRTYSTSPISGKAADAIIGDSPYRQAEPALADLVHEPPMSEDRKRTQAMKNEKKWGKNPKWKDNDIAWRTFSHDEDENKRNTMSGEQDSQRRTYSSSDKSSSGTGNKDEREFGDSLRMDTGKSMKEGESSFDAPADDSRADISDAPASRKGYASSSANMERGKSNLEDSAAMPSGFRTPSSTIGFKSGDSVKGQDNRL